MNVRWSKYKTLINFAKPFAICILIFGIKQYGNAQQVFDHYNKASGLSQSTVLSICKDSKGFMWFGTRDGLNRFDGHTFKVYQYQQNNPHSITSGDYIFSLYNDHSGNLWVGTSNGLDRYLPDEDKFERIQHSSLPGSIIDNNVYCIYQDHANRIWVGTSNGISILESPNSRHFHQFNNLKGYKIYAIYEDAQHVMWLGTTQGLISVWQENNKWQLRTYVHQANNPSSLNYNSVKAIVSDKDGNIWIGMEEGGLDKFSINTQSFTHYVHSSKANSISSNNVRKIIIGRDNKLWIATIDGLNTFDIPSNHFTTIRHSQENDKSLSDNSIKDIYQDDVGSLWIGTMYAGINVLHSGTVPFTIYKNNQYAANSISSNIISAILPVNNALWVGTEGKGLNYFDKGTGKFIRYSHQPEDGKSLSTNFIKAFAESKNGDIWIGLYLGGIDLYNSTSKSFTHYKHINGNAATLSTDNIISLFKDSRNRLWVGTSEGLNIYDSSINNFRKIRLGEIADNDLSAESARVIFEDSKNNLWVGTSAGLNLLKKGGHRWSYFSDSKDSLNETKYGYINCIFEDNAHNLWVGSFRGGLSMYNYKTQTFSNITKENGLPSNNILAIQQDEAGTLWTSTDRGIASFNPSTNSCKNFDTNDGLPSNEFNSNSSAKDNNGSLYFGSYNGLVSFQPANLYKNMMPPKINLTDLKIFNKSILEDSDKVQQIKGLSTFSKIKFNYNENVFTINFAALNFIHPERNKYAYKMEGFEKEWNNVLEPSATYMNLPSGNYTLLIKGSNNDGIWSKVYRLKINILPPWWRTWWAYSLYVIMAIVAFLYAIRFFKRQALLERDLYHEQLNHKKVEELYQLKLDFFTKVSHEIRTPLTLIIAPLEKLMASLHNDTVVSKQLSRIHNNAQRLLQLVSELLDYRKLDAGAVKLNISDIEMVGLCNDVYTSFLDVAEIRKIKFEISANFENLIVAIDKLQFEKVLYNLVSNAFKYTPEGGFIQIKLEKNNEKYLLLHVADNGAGIPEEDKTNIFQEFYQVKSRKIEVEGWGIGLSMVQKIVQLHNGKIWVENEPDKIVPSAKTCFTLQLPYAKQPDIPGYNKENKFLLAPLDKNEDPDFKESSTIIKNLVHKPVVLIIEDNLEVRSFISESLEHLYVILEAGSGYTGLEIATQQIPDLIISDVNMPEMDGLIMCRKLKIDERTSHIPIILLTAQTAYTQQVNGLENGADHYITKPFSFPILELSIKNLLSLSAAMRKKYSQELKLMPTNKTIESVDEIFLSRLMDIIEENMDDPEFKVTDLVIKIGMSQTVLYKKIKALTDLSISDFIKSIRLKRSAQLLLSPSKLPVAEIAYMVGFSDPKYFGKEFRKQYGKSPSEYAFNEKNELTNSE